ncbi:MAG: LysM peptidoglycan-binding domain-containing protein [Chloroflexia bacterium]
MEVLSKGRSRALVRLALAGLLVVILSLGPLSMSAYADSTYKVQPGDNLITIASRFGVSVDAIVAANALPSRSTIYTGQVLVIPSSGSNPAPPPRTGQTSYKVQSGDTLGGIAVRYGVTTDAIARANGLNGNAIYAGQTLVIPAAGSPPPPANTPVPPKPAAPAAPGTYVVQAGDSIIRVAARLGVTQQALAAANGLQPFDGLRIGQVLKIPGQGQAQGTPQPPQAPTATPQPRPTAPATSSTPAAGQPTTTPQPVTSAQGAQPGKPVQYAVQRGDSLSSIAAKFNTTVDALVDLNKLTDRNYVYVGQVLTIVQGNDQSNNPPAAVPTAEPTPPMGEFGPKWVDVNISTQLMTAYEGQTPVFSARASTGVPRHPTVEGTYRIYAKYRSTKMEGGQGAEYYNIPDVPYTMYFYSGYALHGAYWHNNFGRPMSHGCVNLPVDASKWMFDWAPIGTMVVTHR